jgi:hypothetical protein
MAVRVRVRITDGGKSVVVKVLVNGGAESDEPLVVVNPDIASKLGISSSITLIRVHYAWRVWKFCEA